jgi:hypothetical protein
VEKGQEVTDIVLVIPGHGKIKGAVRFADGSGAPGIVVRAIKLDADGKPKYPKHWIAIEPNPLDDDREAELQFDILAHETVTDEVGDYIIEDLQPGNYLVKPSYPEFVAPHEREGEAREQVIQVGEDPVTDIDFVMGDPSVAPETEAGGDARGPVENWSDESTD